LIVNAERSFNLLFGYGSPVSGATGRGGEVVVVVGAVVDVDATTVVDVEEAPCAPPAKMKLDAVAKVRASVIGTRRRIEET
jgi:hypothetical protein